MRISVPVYLVGVALLVATEIAGVTVKGATRWLDIGVGRIQPSEIMKLGLPMMLAWYFHQAARAGCVRLQHFAVAAVVRPRAGGADSSGSRISVRRCWCSGRWIHSCIFLAGLPWKMASARADRRWRTCRRRRLAWTFAARLPARAHPDAARSRHRIPLGAGFHTLQATIAVGSVAVSLGKGWLQRARRRISIFMP